MMGGENTEITTTTKRLLLEAACFNPMNIRRTARKMNLPSEASQRYEKGVDPEGPILSRTGGTPYSGNGRGVICRGIIDNYPKPYSMPRIELRTSRVEKVLGYSVDRDEIEDILNRLGLNCPPCSCRFRCRLCSCRTSTGGVFGRSSFCFAGI